MIFHPNRLIGWGVNSWMRAVAAMFLVWLLISACRLVSPTPLPPTETLPPVIIASPTAVAPTQPVLTSPTIAAPLEPSSTATPFPMPPIPTQPPAPTQPPVQTVAPLPVTLAPLPVTLAPPATLRPLTATVTHPATLRLKIFMIAIGDNGASGPMIGCGDSVVSISIDVPYTQGVLRAALENLLARKNQFHGESGLYNALYQSNLALEAVRIEDGEAEIELSGRALLGGECDTPRVIAQLEQTALQFNTVQRVTILLNGRPIREALSSRGS